MTQINPKIEMKIYIPPQIKTLGFYFIIFISLFLIIRKLLIPETFGEYGHYRGASLGEIESLDAAYAGQELCLVCHEDVFDFRSEGPHKGLACESCHGPAIKHAESGGEVAPDIPSGREFCGRCHNKNAARSSSAIIQVNISEHNIELDCIDCHKPHQPWDQLK